MIRLIFCVLLLVSGSAQATEPGAPLERASAAYLKGGADAFLEALLKGGPLEGDRNALTQANTVRQIESFYGKYEDFDVVADRIITDRVRLVYYVMNYEDAPVFGVISYYRKGDEEIAANFNFHTEIWSIFPADVIFHGVNW